MTRSTPDNDTGDHDLAQRLCTNCCQLVPSKLTGETPLRTPLRNRKSGARLNRTSRERSCRCRSTRPKFAIVQASLECPIQPRDRQCEHFVVRDEARHPMRSVGGMQAIYVVTARRCDVALRVCKPSTNTAHRSAFAQRNTHWRHEGLALPKVVSETHCCLTEMSAPALRPHGKSMPTKRSQRQVLSR